MTTPTPYHIPASDQVETVISDVIQAATIVLAAALGFLTVAVNF